MTLGGLYRRLLRLYPPEFRQEFSEEMISVFEQRAGDRFADSGSVPFALLLREFSSIVKGAYIMRLAQIFPIHSNRSASGSALVPAATLNFEEATKQRDLAIRNMVAAIARHDFVNARQYSDEEARLKGFLEGLQNHASATHSKLA